MSYLKELITSYTSKNMLDIQENEKKLIELLALKKIFSQSYYKDTYYATSIAIDENNEPYFSTNKYDLPPQPINQNFYSLHDNEAEYYGVENIKKYLVEPAVFSRINLFIDIAKDNANDIQKYAENLIKAHKGDSEFLNTVNSFEYLIPNFELFFNKNVGDIFRNNNIDRLESSLSKNVFYFSSNSMSFFNSTKPKLNIDELNASWIYESAKRNESIEKSLSYFENLNDYYNKYSKEITQIMDFIKNEKPFLFKNANIDNVEFSFYEVKGDNENVMYKNFILEENYSIDEQIMKKHNISISEVYSLKPDEGSYKNIKDYVLEFVTRKDNDISENMRSKFYGLDFLNERSLGASIQNKTIILARANDETVGFISFKSLPDDNKSILKKIEYVCVKDNFRGSGLAEELYTKMCGVLYDNGNILANTSYTEQGKSKLPRLKERVRQKFPDFLMIDTDMGNDSHLSKNEKEIASFKQDVNSDFISRLEYLLTDSANRLDNKSEMLKKLYKDTISYIDKNPSKFLSNGKNYNHINNRIEFQEKVSNDLISLMSSPSFKNKL